jgi:formylglycine-generating enzyme required for sulfatase activity
MRCAVEKRLWIVFVLMFASISCFASGEDSMAGAQPPQVSSSNYKAIQEITVPKEYMIEPGMKVNGDGSLVLYVVQIAGDSLEYAVMANKTRLTNKLLDVAKEIKQKTGDKNISLDATDYRYTMVGDLMPSPLWQGVVYGVATATAGPMVLVNSLKPPDYASLYSNAGACPSWFAGVTGEMIAYFARKDNKIKLFADEEIALEDGALPVASAIIRGKRKVYVVLTANRFSLYVDGKKISEDYDAIEPALFYKGTATDSTIAYIAKKSDKSTLVVDGKVQETAFVPSHDLVYAPGGDPFIYAAVSSGREFVVRNGVRVTKDKDFARVRSLTFDRTRTKIAYVARDVNHEWVMINDQKATPDYDIVTFCQEQFRINGELCFAGFDVAKNSIITGKVAVPAAETPADKTKNDIPLYDGKPVPKIGDVLTNPKDAAEMVWVPAGGFTMGGTEGYKDQEPQRSVYLDGYWMYKYEVTVAQYRKFCEATKREMPEAPRWGWKENHPMARVSWQDSADYAKWAGVALPTEAQWEKASRGTDGRTYPWGNDWDATKCANSVEAQLKSTKPIGSYPTGVSPYGCMDMAGNAWEWCADWYGPKYYANAPTKNPTGPPAAVKFKEAGKTYEGTRVMRGGSWDFVYRDYFRCAHRASYDPTDRYALSGFRCARTS